MSQCHNVTMSHMHVIQDHWKSRMFSWPQASERPALDLESDAIL